MQGLFGLANGGLIGTGLGQGRPDITPVAESDYIIASLGEELGLVGLFAILALYLLLRRPAVSASASPARTTSAGCSASASPSSSRCRCFIVIGGVTRVIPLTGLTTPFLAAGGSSLVANWIIVGPAAAALRHRAQPARGWWIDG